MSPTQRCPECGAPLPADAPGGLCPRCLLVAGRELVAGDASSDRGTRCALPAAALPRSFGDYELLEEIARGGMGVVFRARQISLNREVAIKMILAGQLATTADVRRFRAEAEAAASLQHPNIVAIYEVGEIEGQHFFSMEYVAGRSLAELARDGSLTARRAADWVRHTARAIHYAHQRGVLHRDLKPSNVLIDAFDQPRVTDFGLAKRLITPTASPAEPPRASRPDVSEPGGTPSLSSPTCGPSEPPQRSAPGGADGLTLSGQLVGSPHFMPPEQASARCGRVGPWSDVYSLGGTLYYCLTGRSPFVAETLGEILHRVVNADPIPPRVLNPSIPRDLETICLKCLEKGPPRRYASAEALADDLGRFLHDEPVQARAASRCDKLLRWCRRHPATAGLSASLVLLIVLGFSGVLWQLQRSHDDAESDRQRLVRLNVAAGMRLMDAGDPLSALPWFVEALSLDQGRPAEEAIHRLRLGTTLDHCPKLLQTFTHEHRITRATLSPDGRRVVTASADHTVRLWDTLTGEPLFRPLSHPDPVTYAGFTPDGRRVVTSCTDRAVRIWDPATGTLLVPPMVHGSEPRRVRFSPDGQRLLTVSSMRDAPGEVRVWNVNTGAPLTPPLPHALQANDAAFAPDGQKIVTASGARDRSGEVRLWDADTGAPLGEPVAHRDPVWSVAFSPDGRQILLALGNYMLSGSAELWDAALTKRLLPPMRHSAQVNQVAFSPDASGFATASEDKTARVWNAMTGEPLTPSLPHEGPLTDVDFRPDGRQIATSSQDRTVRIWDAATGTPIGPPLRHLGIVFHVEWSPEGGRLLSQGTEFVVRLWGPASDSQSSRVLAHPGIVRHAAFSPDGKRVVTGAAFAASPADTVRMWDAASGDFIKALIGHTRAVSWLRFSPDGGRILTVSHDGTARLWDAASGEALGSPLQHSNVVYFGSFSPDGRRVVSASWDNTARVWNAFTGEPITPPMRHQEWVWQADFSPDGRRILTASGDTFSARSTVELWDAETGRRLPLSIAHRDSVEVARFSPDGQRIVIALADGTTRICDATTGEPLVPPLKHEGVVRWASFSPEGQRVATASVDSTARLWDARTGEPITQPLRHGGEVGYVGWSTDGRFVVTASADSSARVWEASTGEPVTPFLRHRENRVEHAEFSPDGLRLVSAGWDRTARIWELAATQRPLRELTLLAETLSAHQWDRNGRLIPLDARALRQRLHALHELEGADSGVTSERVLAWHEAEARKCESAGQSFAALFHLERLSAARPGDSSLLRRREQAAAGWARQRAPMRSQPIPPRDSRAPKELIDLSAHYNLSLAQDQPVSSEGNTLAAVPTGLQTFAGTPFDVRGIIQLSGQSLRERHPDSRPLCPPSVKNIAVACRGRRLHLLHGVRDNGAEGTQVGTVILSYTRGYRVELPIVYGADVLPWWFKPGEQKQPTRAILAWTGTNAVSFSRGYALQLFKSTWENPLPDEEIASLDFVSTMSEAAPFLIAITME